MDFFFSLCRMQDLGFPIRDQILICKLWPHFSCTSNVSIKTFKELQINSLETKIEKMQEMFNKDLEEIKKSQL